MGKMKFNYGGEKFRLHIREPRYDVDEQNRTVTVTAQVSVSIPEFISKTIGFETMPQGFAPDSEYPFGGVYGHEAVEMSWTARCAPEDEFDAEKGKKIALSKLESNAYFRFTKSLNNWARRLALFANHSINACDDFVYRGTNAALHDLRYIDDITN